MNRVVHYEIHATDMGAMQKFYSSVFGWDMQKGGPEYGGYVMIVNGPGMDKPEEMVKNPGINGGMMARNAPKAAADVGPNAYLSIISVDDVDSYVKKITAAGGTIALEKVLVPKVGNLAYCKDPDGNLFGILKPERG